MSMPRLVRVWQVTPDGMGCWFTPHYFYELPVAMLRQRAECHIAGKTETVRGPLADFERVLASARERHGVAAPAGPCYCGQHRA